MSDKRNELEKKAVNTVQQVGLSNLSFRTLADDAGIKSSSVHYYFPEKADLANAIIRKYTEQFGEQLRGINRKQLSVTKSIESFIKIFEDVVNEDKLCLCGMMAAEVFSLQDESRVLLQNYFTLAEDWLFEIIKANEDRLCLNVKPRQLARILMSGLEGAILIDRVEGKSIRLRAQRDLVRKLFNST